MKKYRIKNSVKIIGLIIILLIIIFTVTRCNTSKSYSLEYNIKKYDISENYDINKELYYYEISKDNIKYNFIYKSEHLEETKLIKNIKEYESGSYKCLTIDSNYIESKPLCSKDEKLIDYHLINDELKEELQSYFKKPEQINKKYNNYILYANENILIWNYKGFNYLNKKEIKEIDLFKKDIYEIPISAQLNEYIVIPDYEQNYNFNKMYVINLETYEVEEWTLNYDISFNSYVNGVHDKSIYITDIKNSTQYELVPHKQKMRVVGKKGKQGVVYKNGIEEKISINELTKKQITFTSSNPYIYTIEKNYLYLTYLDSNIKTKISNNKIDKIISVNNDTIYYLKDSILYRYNQEYGEIKVIEYEEWNYNNINPIFIDN